MPASRLERVDVELDVVGQGMAGREVLDLKQRGAGRAIELDDPAPVGVRREAVLAFDDGRVDFARIPMGDQAALLVGVTRVAQIVSAALAHPPLAFEVDLEVLGDASRHVSQASSMIALPEEWTLQTAPSGMR